MIKAILVHGVYYAEDENGDKVAGPFSDNAAAWRYVDRMNGEAVSIAEKKADWAWDRGVYKGL